MWIRSTRHSRTSARILLANQADPARRLVCAAELTYRDQFKHIVEHGSVDVDPEYSNTVELPLVSSWPIKQTLHAD
jgi:hypothetical protein